MVTMSYTWRSFTHTCLRPSSNKFTMANVYLTSWERSILFLPIVISLSLLQLNISQNGLNPFQWPILSVRKYPSSSLTTSYVGMVLLNPSSHIMVVPSKIRMSINYVRDSISIIILPPHITLKVMVKLRCLIILKILKKNFNDVDCD